MADDSVLISLKLRLDHSFFQREMEKAARIMEASFKNVSIVSPAELKKVEESFKRWERYSERIKRNMGTREGSFRQPPFSRRGPTATETVEAVSSMSVLSTLLSTKKKSMDFRYPQLAGGGEGMGGIMHPGGSSGNDFIRNLKRASAVVAAFVGVITLGYKLTRTLFTQASKSQGLGLGTAAVTTLSKLPFGSDILSQIASTNVEVASNAPLSKIRLLQHLLPLATLRGGSGLLRKLPATYNLAPGKREVAQTKIFEGYYHQQEKYHERHGDTQATARSMAAQDTAYALHAIGLGQLKNFIFSDLISHHRGIQSLAKRSMEGFSTKHLAESANATYAIANMVATAAKVTLIAGTVATDSGVQKTQDLMTFLGDAPLLATATQGISYLTFYGKPEEGINMFHGNRQHKTIGVGQ